ncbi:MAG TPA: dTDP-4-dehydrorhamnose reductase [Candidatus Krumholzibacterium sp.]|nr:dTDP-4-dehydrorhamnose reductase [Candidatus Krumholzibacterium sp.]
MKKIYVTGARGMLGSAVTKVFSGHFHVRATDLPECDVTDKNVIRTEIKKFYPDVVLHLASMTDVDRCELDPESASRINRDGTRNVAMACLETGALMVYVSTGMIYNGLKPYPYIEYDRPCPLSVYGRTKYEGEQEIRDALDRYLIVNSCWIFGGGVQDKKFVPRILQLAREKDHLDIVDDKFGTPTYTVDLASGILALIREGMLGRVHCVNRGVTSRYEMARTILDIAGIRDCELRPVSSDNFDLPAPRPRMEGMSGYRMDMAGLGIMRGWKEALSEYIDEGLT